MSLFFLLDILGTLAFAISGAFQGIRHKCDVLGLIILATATGTGGGIIRDLIIGQTPPSAFVNSEYIWTCIAAAVISFFFAPYIAKRWRVIDTFDAIGLGVFVVIGCSKALLVDMTFIGIIFCGTVTAVGGGVIRDVLTNETPNILKTGFYASSAIIGSIAYYFSFITLADAIISTVIGVSVTVCVRGLSLYYDINLPVAQRKS